ncbi:Bromo adjacent -like proteiny domain-containing 1 protein [Triplophysa tibetana]|uniref:Bromo adjacent-like proteiny domain-containing 1 protein n=1 Tax=Triplophysa tibetana TaxID=1572043 RepID=A0A5A9NGY2_9TELE|nr:Bromo adjacent -like proteiny domain-containing 1 protein [Triplophysa tibetana]
MDLVAVRIVVSVVGVVGNTILIMSILKLARVKTFEMILLALAALNLEVIVIVNVYDVLLRRLSVRISVWSCRLLKFFTMFGEIGSILLTVVISIYRYQKLRDVHTRINLPVFMDNMHHAVGISAFCAILALIFSVPAFLVHLNEDQGNSTHLGCAADFFQCSLSTCPIPNRIYKYSFLLVCIFLPLLIVTLTSSMIVRILIIQQKVVRARQDPGVVVVTQQQQHSRKSSFQRSTVAVLAAMVLFQVDWSIYLILHLASNPQSISSWSEIEFFIATFYTAVSPYVYGLGLLRDHVMTHAQRKHSLAQYHGERRDHIECWSHVDTVGGARPAPSMRAGKAKRDMMKKVKAKVLVHTETWMQSNDRSQDLAKLKKSKRDVSKRINTPKRQRAEQSRKLYPLRGRSGPESEALSCHVLLTRLYVHEECEVNTDTGLDDKTSLKSKMRRTGGKRETSETHEAFVREPRKRRIASLNAEAVNSLLLERTQSGAKLSKKHREGAVAPEQAKTRPNSKQSSETCEKATTQEKSVSEVDVFAPTPRRVAGLNAAALMKLTSSTTAHKHRIKTDRKAACLSGKDDVHRKSKKSKKESRRDSGVTDVCEVCKSRKQKLEDSPETKAAYHSCDMLGYPLNMVKEEQVESDVSSYYCCPSEGSVEYCHRLALFLRQKEDDMTSVKRECLIPLSAHPCLCADPCYSGYYVHIAHAAPAAATLSFCPRAELLSSSHPLLCNSPCFHETFIDRRPCSYSSSCSRCTRPIKTGNKHIYTRSSLSSTLLVKGHMVSSYAAVLPTTPAIEKWILLGLWQALTNRDVQFNRRLNKQRCRSHPDVCAWYRAQCPLPFYPCSIVIIRGVRSGFGRNRPRTPLAGLVPRLISTASERRHTHERLKRCPQNTKAPNTSFAMSQTRLSPKHPTAGGKQKKVDQQQVTNGWRPVGEPTEKEVFIANEIFASRHQDENSVACIEDRCYVLPLAQYCRFCALVKRQSEGVNGGVPVVPDSSDSLTPPHRLVPDDVDPDLVYLCRHVYDFKHGRILKNLQ